MLSRIVKPTNMEIVDCCVGLVDCYVGLVACCVGLIDY